VASTIIKEGDTEASPTCLSPLTVHGEKKEKTSPRIAKRMEKAAPCVGFATSSTHYIKKNRKEKKGIGRAGGKNAGESRAHATEEPRNKKVKVSKLSELLEMTADREGISEALSALWEKKDDQGPGKTLFQKGVELVRTHEKIFESRLLIPDVGKAL